MRQVLTSQLNNDKCVEMLSKIMNVQPVSMKSRMEQQMKSKNLSITPTSQSQISFIKNERIMDSNKELMEGGITKSMHHPERELASTTHSLMFKKDFSPAERVMLYSKLHEGLLDSNVKALDSLSAAKLRSFIQKEGLLHQYKQVSTTLYGSKNFANASKVRLVEFLKERVMTEPDSEGNVRLISAPGGIHMFFSESDMDEILKERYGKDYATEVEAHMYGFDASPGTHSGSVNYSHARPRTVLPILQEQNQEELTLTSIVAAQKEQELPFILPTRRKSDIEKESLMSRGSSMDSTTSSQMFMPRTPSREEAYEMPVEEPIRRSDSRLAQTMNIMGLGDGF